MKTNKVEHLLKKLIERNKTPSVQYIIFNKDDIIFEFINGHYDLKSKNKVNKHTTYNIFSVTKTFTALSILQLAEKEKLELSEKVKYYLPNFPFNPDTNIIHLLTHTSGIPNPNPLSWIHLAEEHSSFSTNRFFNPLIAKYKNPKTKLNEKFAYSNLGYLFLGQLIEKISGQHFEDYVNDHIITPLELFPNELGFEIINVENHAKGYLKKMSFLNFIMNFLIDKSKFTDATENGWKPFKNFYVNGAAYGGLIASSQAIVTYIKELLNPNSKLISETYKKLMFIENRTNNELTTNMALSWFSGQLNGKRYFAHPGGGGGYYSEIRIYPEIGLGSLIMLNKTEIRNRNYLHKTDKQFIDKNDSIAKKYLNPQRKKIAEKLHDFKYF